MDSTRFYSLFFLYFKKSPNLDAVREAIEYCDQNVHQYIAGASGVSDKEMRQI
jgi:hypothetical protein